VLLLDVKPFYSFIVFSETNIFLLRLHHLNVAAFSRSETPATGRSPHMKSQQCGTEEEAAHVYWPSLRFWAEPVDATQKEQKQNGE
jgi:hypothetical protein